MGKGWTTPTPSFQKQSQSVSFGVVTSTPIINNGSGRTPYLIKYVVEWVEKKAITT